MQKIIRNTLLNYIPTEFISEKVINPARVFEFAQNRSSNNTGKHVAYILEREIRAKDNFAIQFAINKAHELESDLKIIHPKIVYDNDFKNDFINKQIMIAKNNFPKINLDLEIFEGSSIELVNYLQDCDIGTLIIDFNPILNRNYLKKTHFKIYEIDGHNIIPARYVSDKQEYSAATLRRKIYHNIGEFLTEYDNKLNIENEFDVILKDFIENRLPNYAQFKNNPTKDVLSGLSKYLNLGFISSARVAMEVIKSDASAENKETFLEELITRKELADNFCLYSKNFKNFKSIPNWAKHSLVSHQTDLRNHVYSKKKFEKAQTYDKLWNATQIQLEREGVIHGYLRMYWAKKILEWSISPQVALNTAIYLNDKYAHDAPSPNGYVGILWAIGSLHDRAFQDRLVTGKIRQMTYNSLKSKFDIEKYINKYN